MSDIKKQLGKRIKEIRKERGLTQEKLAELVGIGTPNISYIENGRFAPAMETLQKIAIALNVAPHELYRFNVKEIAQIREELFRELEKDEHLLEIIYEIFLSLRFFKGRKH